MEKVVHRWCIDDLNPKLISLFLNKALEVSTDADESPLHCLK